MVGNRKAETVFIKGKIFWCKNVTPDPVYNKWSVTVYPNEESLAKVKELKKEGIQNHLKMDDDGWYISFSRPCERKFRGRVEGMAPPMIIDSEGKPLDKRVGNGSDGIVKLDVYSHKTMTPGQFKKAARWEGLRVDNLIEFNPDSDYPEHEKEKLKPLIEEEPEALF